MPTFKEIQDRVVSLVQDPALVATIPALINQGVFEIAGGMLSNFGDIITPPLAELLAIGKVTTDVTNAFVDMPSDFHRGLHFAVKASGSEVDIANSFINFTETNPALDKVGAISEVIEYGGKLYYLNIPSIAEDVTLHYYRNPVDMVADSDLPDGIPEHLQMSLLSNFALWKAYEFIENGTEGETPNTMKYLSFFQIALKTLEISLPHDTRGLQLR